LILPFLPNLSSAAYISDYTPTSHWSCDETSGVRYDSNTTNSNDLTDNNTVSYAAGLLSNACDFESSNSEYLSITDASQQNLDYNSSFTISVWLKPESLPSNDVAMGLFDKYVVDSAGYIAYLENYSGYFTDIGYSNGSINWRRHTYSLSSGNWYHYVFVIVPSATGTDTKVYVNGTAQSQSYTSGTQTSISNGNADFKIGHSPAKHNAASVVFYDGLMDEISLFPTALSSGDVTTLYNSGTPLAYSSGGDPPATSTASSTTSVLDDSDILFMLAVIIFFLAFIWFGFIMNAFRKR